MWTVPHYSRLGGIVGLHYLSQVSWPVSLFVLCQLPDHLHYGLVWSLHQPICLWVVWHHLQSLHAEEHTHFINDAAYEVSTRIAQDPGQGSEDWDVTLIQEIDDCFSCLIGGHICHNMLHEMVLEHQGVGDSRQFVNSMVVPMLVKSMCKRSSGVVATIGCRGTLGKLPLCCKQCEQDLMDCCIWLIIPGHQRHSHSNDKVQFWPWWPASLWHLFSVATQWAVGTTNSSRSSVSPLGIEYRYKAPWWIIKFSQFCKISQPSSLEACSNRSAFKSVFFYAFSQSKTALNIWTLPLNFSPISDSASVQACGLLQHIPLAPKLGHHQLWQGHELWPDMLLLELLHWG